jgi:2-keto-4-pentenoate hydratase/2-oxohepta-3-ene-1,7-dioic acid hydratase in catechol pathway
MRLVSFRTVAGRPSVGVADPGGGGVHSLDHEAELGVVVGRTGSHVDPADPLAHVAGYTCLLDMTMRGGEDRSTRTPSDTFTPRVPTPVTSGEAGPPDRLVVRCEANRALRQHAAVADLVRDVPRLIAYASSVMVLHPGDRIPTGTPAGIGQAGNGDETTMQIGRVGTLRVSVDARARVLFPTRGADAGPVPPPAELTPVGAR